MSQSAVRPEGESMRLWVSDAEWAVRIHLAAFCRLAALHEMTDLVLGHLSARVPGTTDRFLLNPGPMLFEQITASTLASERGRHP